MGLAAAATFLAVNLTMESSGMVVGAPGVAQRATMVTVLISSNISRRAGRRWSARDDPGREKSGVRGSAAIITIWVGVDRIPFRVTLQVQYIHRLTRLLAQVRLT